VSPLNPGNAHSGRSVIQASTHEYSHTIIQSINEKTPKYLDEGLSMYFANQVVDYKFIESKEDIPKLEELFYMKNNSINSLKFGLNNGYTYSYVYAEFLIENYGLDKVKGLIRKPKNIEGILGESPINIYDNFVKFLESNYLKQ